MSIRHFCDACGEELTPDRPSGLSGNYYKDGRRIYFDVFASHNSSRDCGEFCCVCIREAIDSTRVEKET